MKTLLKIVGGIVAVLLLALVVLRIVGFPPNATRPGLWLTGNLVTAPVIDWSFTEKYPLIEIQTQPWYLIPHSVTVTCVSYKGNLYLTSQYDKGIEFPNGRSWHRDIVRNPYVRLKIGDNLYDVKISHVVTDPAERDPALKAKEQKYPPYGKYLNRTHPLPPGAHDVLLRVN